jgi:hypothetical protein
VPSFLLFCILFPRAKHRLFILEYVNHNWLNCGRQHASSVVDSHLSFIERIVFIVFGK